MASRSPTTAPINASGGCSGSAGLDGAGKASGSIRGPATTRGGGRRDAEKIGRSWVAVSAESGTDHNGFPLTGGLAISRFGSASGLRFATSIRSEGAAISFGNRSSVVEVAARHADAEATVRARPDNRPHDTTLRILSPPPLPPRDFTRPGCSLVGTPAAIKPLFACRRGDGVPCLWPKNNTEVQSGAVAGLPHLEIELPVAYPVQGRYFSNRHGRAPSAGQAGHD